MFDEPPGLTPDTRALARALWGDPFDIAVPFSAAGARRVKAGTRPPDIAADNVVTPMDDAFEKLFNHSIDMLCVAGLDGYFKRVNPAFERVLGWSSEELLSTPFVDFVHPDDVAATLREVEKLATDVPTVAFENRYRCADGTYKNLLWTAHPESSTGLLYAVAQNITGRKRAEERFRVALEASPSAMIMVDVNGRIVLVNREAERLFGYEHGQLLGAPVDSLLPEGARHRHVAARQAYFTAPHKRPMGAGREFTARRRDGSVFPVEIGLNPIRTSDGTFVLSAIIDLTERKRAERKIRDQADKLVEINRELIRLASTDALTGLRNRRAFLEQMDVQIEIARRFGRPLSLLLLDVDDFKLYNDQFGHSAGDDVLKTLAGVLCKTSRRSDCPARYGGEEFAVILPETDRAGATRLGERYRAAIAGARWPHRGITSSIGAATIELDAGDARLHDACVRMLVEGADRALYCSKARGKNRLTHVLELASGAPASA